MSTNIDELNGQLNRDLGRETSPLASPSGKLRPNGSDLSVSVDNNHDRPTIPIKRGDNESRQPTGSLDNSKPPTLRGRQLDTVLPQRSSTARELGRSFLKAAALVLPGVAMVVIGTLVGGPIGAVIGLGAAVGTTAVNGGFGLSDKLVDKLYGSGDRERAQAQKDSYQALKALDNQGQLSDKLLNQWSSLSASQQRALMKVDPQWVGSPKLRSQVRQAAILALGDAMDRGLSKDDAFRHAKAALAQGERSASAGMSPLNLKHKAYRAEPEQLILDRDKGISERKLKNPMGPDQSNRPLMNKQVSLSPLPPHSHSSVNKDLNDDDMLDLSLKRERNDKPGLSIDSDRGIQRPRINTGDSIDAYADNELNIGFDNEPSPGPSPLHLHPSPQQQQHDKLIGRPLNEDDFDRLEQARQKAGLVPPIDAAPLDRSRLPPVMDDEHLNQLKTRVPKNGRATRGERLRGAFDDFHDGKTARQRAHQDVKQGFKLLCDSQVGTNRFAYNDEMEAVEQAKQKAENVALHALGIRQTVKNTQFPAPGLVDDDIARFKELAVVSALVEDHYNLAEDLNTQSLTKKEREALKQRLQGLDSWLGGLQQQNKINDVEQRAFRQDFALLSQSDNLKAMRQIEADHNTIADQITQLQDFDPVADKDFRAPDGPDGNGKAARLAYAQALNKAKLAQTYKTPADKERALKELNDIKTQLAQRYNRARDAFDEEAYPMVERYQHLGFEADPRAWSLDVEGYPELPSMQAPTRRAVAHGRQMVTQALQRIDELGLDDI